jgi:hypothetical protein
MTRAADPKVILSALKKFADYEPETGKFICINTGKGRSVAIGGELGHISKTNGYRYIIINGLRFSCHALAYLWMIGDWHVDQLDHINHCCTDNRWDNLQVSTAQRNQFNRVRQGGVGFHKASGKYRAYITVNGKAQHLGLFFTKEEAQKAYNAAYIKVVGRLADANT